MDRHGDVDQRDLTALDQKLFGVFGIIESTIIADSDISLEILTIYIHVYRGNSLDKCS